MPATTRLTPFGVTLGIAFSVSALAGALVKPGSEEPRVADSHGRGHAEPAADGREDHGGGHAASDTAAYHHRHPRKGQDGVWSVGLELPDGGVYRAFADFTVGGRQRTLATVLFVPR